MGEVCIRFGKDKAITWISAGDENCIIVGWSSCDDLMSVIMFEESCSQLYAWGIISKFTKYEDGGICWFYCFHNFVDPGAATLANIPRQDFYHNKKVLLVPVSVSDILNQIWRYRGSTDIISNEFSSRFFLIKEFNKMGILIYICQQRLLVFFAERFIKK